MLCCLVNNFLWPTMMPSAFNGKKFSSSSNNFHVMRRNICKLQTKTTHTFCAFNELLNSTSNANVLLLTPIRYVKCGKERIKTTAVENQCGNGKPSATQFLQWNLIVSYVHIRLVDSITNDLVSATRRIRRFFSIEVIFSVSIVIILIRKNFD